MTNFYSLYCNRGELFVHYLWLLSAIYQKKMKSYYGFKKRLASGSHVTYQHPLLVNILTVPAHKPIKPIYIKKLLKLIDELKNES